MAGPALCVLALLLVPASAAAPPRRAASKQQAKPAAPKPPETLEEDRRLQEVMARVDALVAEARPLIAEVVKLRGRYADGDLEALGKERLPVVHALEEKRELIRDQIDEFKTLRKEFQFRQGAAIISAIAGGASADVQDSLRKVMDYDNYPKDVSRFRDEIDEALRADLSAFDQAKSAREAGIREKQFLAAAAGGSVLFLGFVVWLARRARARRLETLTAVPVTVTPAPALRAGTQPALGMRTPLPTLRGPGSTPAPRRVDPTPGAVIGGSWRVLSAPFPNPLGTVFEGEEVQGRRAVTIRRIRDELHRNEKDLDRFLERARHVSALKHPNISEVLAVFVEDDRVHIVTERVEGKVVGDFLEPGRRINLPSVKRVLLQAAKAVEHAHQAKVIHGDLSPQCLTVTRDGLAKVADFGIGIEARKIAAKLSWTDPIGNPAYLAPEQELGSAFKESDVFALGVLLYEMTTGALPFEGPNFLAQKRERACKPPSGIAPGLPKALDPLISKCLSPEPQHRFRTVADFAEALEKLPDA
ncbi:MAG: serine/threonine protein kinase [Elusimicrobia bacterium]|nr:serine/threonine protein kinase [Elusimicrobiota bacterium]